MFSCLFVVITCVSYLSSFNGGRVFQAYIAYVFVALQCILLLCCIYSCCMWLPFFYIFFLFSSCFFCFLLNVRFCKWVALYYVVQCVMCCAVAVMLRWYCVTCPLTFNLHFSLSLPHPLSCFPANLYDLYSCIVVVVLCRDKR